MHRTIAKTMLIVLALILGAGSFSMAAAQMPGMMDPGHTWHQGAGWRQDSFSATGVVSAIDAAALTATIKLDGTSRLLKDAYGTDFAFVISDTVQVTAGCNDGVGHGKGMMAGGMGHHEGTYGNHARLTLDNVQVKDNVRAYGYLDTTTGSYIVTQITVWLY